MIPRHSRKGTITLGSVMVEICFMRPPHCPQARESICKTRAINSAQGLRLLRTFVSVVCAAESSVVSVVSGAESSMVCLDGVINGRRCAFGAKTP